MKNDTKRWQLAATPEETKRVRDLDKELDRLRIICKRLSYERVQITNRCNSRANGRGL